jgi:trimethylamine--corrinoid protein Co-methyltransferase
MVGDWGLNDSEEPGVPHSFSETMGIALSTMSGTDLQGGIGAMDCAKGVSPVQEVIDAYVWENVKKQMTPFEISKETAALDVIRKVGHGNTFLTSVHTVRNFRKEVVMRDSSKARFEATMSKAMVAEAREIALKLLKEHVVPPLDRTIIQQGNDIIRKHEKALMSRR